jgi:hypothetical protein
MAEEKSKELARVEPAKPLSPFEEMEKTLTSSGIFRHQL